MAFPAPITRSPSPRSHEKQASVPVSRRARAFAWSEAWGVGFGFKSVFLLESMPIAEGPSTQISGKYVPKTIITIPSRETLHALYWAAKQN